MGTFFQDDNLNQEKPCGQARITFPFEGDSHAPTVQIAWLVHATNVTARKYQLFDPDPIQTNSCGDSFIIEQDFQQFKDFFSPLPIGTLYNFAFWPDYAGTLPIGTAMLISESPTQDLGAGQVRWTRTYATLPLPRNTYESFVFTFPGLFPTVAAQTTDQLIAQIESGVVSDGSPSVTAEIIARVEHIFFHLDPGGSYSPNYTDPSRTDYIVPQFRVFYNTFSNEQPNCYGSSYTGNLTFTKTSDGSPGTRPMKNTIPPVNDTDNEGDSGIPYANPANPAGALLGTAEICVKQSIIRPWRGNIYEKITLFALAQ